MDGDAWRRGALRILAVIGTMLGKSKKVFYKPVDPRDVSTAIGQRRQ